MKSNRNNIAVPKGAAENNRLYCFLVYKYRKNKQYSIINPATRKTEWIDVPDYQKMLYGKIMKWGSAGKDGQIFQKTMNDAIIRDCSLKKIENINLIDVIDVFQYTDAWKEKFDIILKNYKRIEKEMGNSSDDDVLDDLQPTQSDFSGEAIDDDEKEVENE